MNIVLIGYRGSGKTTIGRKLADQLWKRFVDSDAEVCRRMGGRTIKQIWEQDGEAAFRRAECDTLADLLKGDEQVIALGGGTVMRPAARAALEAADHCRCIYLKCDAEELFKRIHSDPQTAATRPNLTSLGGGVEEVRHVLAERGPVYEAVADAVLDVTPMSPEDAACHIIRRCL